MVITILVKRHYILPYKTADVRINLISRDGHMTIFPVEKHEVLHIDCVSAVLVI